MQKKLIKIKHRILNILFWSVVSAAFIGPGTVTTVTKAGAYYHYDLMWTIIFSIFAALLLQEASASITIYSGMNLGQAIAKYFQNRKGRGLVLALVVGAIILGSAAYETGNILGAVEGLHFVFRDVQKIYFVIGIGFFAILAFSLKSVRLIAQFMGSFVFLMGIAFLTTAFFVKPDMSEVLKVLLFLKFPMSPVPAYLF
jgi:NRAMP (natural resistance-associated macrophage protein)-like metal ion transporter